MGLNVNEIELVNPDDTTYMLQINMLRDIFNNDYEVVIGGLSAIKNTKLLFFKSSSELAIASNVVTTDGDLQLEETSIVQKDSLDSLGLSATESKTVPTTNGSNSCSAVSDEGYNFVVKNNAETTTYINNTDYTVNITSGVVSRIDDSTIEDVTPDGSNSGVGSFYAAVGGRECELSDSTEINYKIEIDGAGDDDTATFKWSDDGGSTWNATGVAMGGDKAVHDLSNGVQIKTDCGPQDSYGLGDFWTFSATGSSTAINKGETIKVIYDKQTTGTWHKEISDDYLSYKISSETSAQHEGSGAMEFKSFAIASGNKCKVYKDISSEDWTSYDYIRVWINSDHASGSNAPKVRCMINDSDAGQDFQLDHGASEITIDITSENRSAVTSFGFKIEAKDAVDYELIIDDYRLVSSTVAYETSGYCEGINLELDYEIEEIFVYKKDNTLDDPDLSVTLKVSLDDGSNWHTLTDNDFENWVDVSGWTEFTTKTDLNIRVELATSDNTKTPQFDDVAVAYKLKG